MTPFTEDLLEASPTLAPYFEGAIFHDLNAKSEQIHARCKRYVAEQDAFTLPDLPQGPHWFEVSGVDPRVRVGYATILKGQELYGEVVVQKNGEIMTTEGVVWVLVSKLAPMARVLSNGSSSPMNVGFAVLLAALVEASA